MRVYTGCSGYFYFHWKGKFYPADASPSEFFTFYSKIFNTVEINSTFYRWPKKSNLKRWLSNAPEGFQFTVKMHRTVTHERKMVDSSELISQFYDIAGGVLGDALLCILFQFPPGFHYSDENLNRLTAVRYGQHPGFNIAVEFRHKSWWHENVLQKLEAMDVIPVSVSAPNLPDTLWSPNKKMYLRFHGKTKYYNYHYSDEELMAYITKIKANRPELLLAYFNNDINANAPANALRFRQLLQSEAGLKD